MKKYIPYLVIFLIGALAGMWAHRQYRPYEPMESIQNDTTVRLDTIKYSNLELIGKNYRLDIPKVNVPELVYIPSDSINIIYRDSVRYVTLPRQYFFTETEDAEIWHSGVDSRIDSLNVFRQTKTITQKPVTKLNALSLGMDLGYSCRAHIPIYLQYEYKLHKNVVAYGRIFYDTPVFCYGVSAGMRLQIEW